MAVLGHVLVCLQLGLTQYAVMPPTVHTLPWVGLSQQVLQLIPSLFHHLQPVPCQATQLLLSLSQTLCQFASHSIWDKHDSLDIRHLDSSCTHSCTPSLHLACASHLSCWQAHLIIFIIITISFSLLLIP